MGKNEDGAPDKMKSSKRSDSTKKSKSKNLDSSRSLKKSKTEAAPIKKSKTKKLDKSKSAVAHPNPHEHPHDPPGLMNYDSATTLQNKRAPPPKAGTFDQMMAEIPPPIIDPLIESDRKKRIDGVIEDLHSLTDLNHKDHEQIKAGLLDSLSKITEELDRFSKSNIPSDEAEGDDPHEHLTIHEKVDAIFDEPTILGREIPVPTDTKDLMRVALNHMMGLQGDYSAAQERVADIAEQYEDDIRKMRRKRSSNVRISPDEMLMNILLKGVDYDPTPLPSEEPSEQPVVVHKMPTRRMPTGTQVPHKPNVFADYGNGDL